MEWWLSLSILVLLLVVFLSTGLPVAFCFILLSIVGFFFFAGGDKGLLLIAQSAYSSLGSFSVVPIAMFILMGDILLHSGVIYELLDAVDVWIGRFRGGLCLVCVAVSALVGAMTGSIVGVVAMLGPTLVPEMVRRGYDRKLSIGTLLGGSILAPIIPPSSLAVLLGSVGQISIAKLLIGGIVPGLLLASLFAVYIIVIVRIKPQLAPAYVGDTQISIREKLIKTSKALPFAFIIFAVIGTMMLGIGTPSEASAAGAVSCYVVAALYGRLKWSLIKKSLLSSMETSGMILLLLAGSAMFNQLLGISGASVGFVTYVTGLPLSPVMMVVAIQIVVFLLGLPFDSYSILMITLPLFLPVIRAAGVNEVWFGLIFLVNLCAAPLTPPIGGALFVANNVVPESSMEEIYWASIPYCILAVIGIGTMIAFPEIALWLPNIMMK